VSDAPRQPLRLCKPSEVATVVDLAVEGQAVPPRRLHHRLMAREAQVDDRQSAVAERDPCGRVHPKSRVVRSALHQPVAHLHGARRSIICNEPCRREEARYPAHLNRRDPMARLQQ